MGNPKKQSRGITGKSGGAGKSSLLDLGSLFPSTTLEVTFVLVGRELGGDSMEKPGQVTAILGIWVSLGQQGLVCVL